MYQCFKEISEMNFVPCFTFITFHMFSKLFSLWIKHCYENHLGPATHEHYVSVTPDIQGFWLVLLLFFFFYLYRVPETLPQCICIVTGHKGSTSVLSHRIWSATAHTTITSYSITQQNWPLKRNA